MRRKRGVNLLRPKINRDVVPKCYVRDQNQFVRLCVPLTLLNIHMSSRCNSFLALSMCGWLCLILSDSERHSLSVEFIFTLLPATAFRLVEFSTFSSTFNHRTQKMAGYTTRVWDNILILAHVIQTSSLSIIIPIDFEMLPLPSFSLSDLLVFCMFALFN